MGWQPPGRRCTRFAEMTNLGPCERRSSTTPAMLWTPACCRSDYDSRPVLSCSRAELHQTARTEDTPRRSRDCLRRRNRFRCRLCVARPGRPTEPRTLERLVSPTNGTPRKRPSWRSPSTPGRLRRSTTPTSAWTSQHSISSACRARSRTSKAVPVCPSATHSSAPSWTGNCAGSCSSPPSSILDLPWESNSKCAQRPTTASRRSLSAIGAIRRGLTGDIMLRASVALAVPILRRIHGPQGEQRRDEEGFEKGPHSQTGSQPDGRGCHRPDSG